MDTNCLSSTFTPGVRQVYLTPLKCDPLTAWTVPSLGPKSKSNPHVIPNRKRNKKSLLQPGTGTNPPAHTRAPPPTSHCGLGEKEGFSSAQAFTSSLCQARHALTSHFTFGAAQTSSDAFKCRHDSRSTGPSLLGTQLRGSVHPHAAHPLSVGTPIHSDPLKPTIPPQPMSSLSLAAPAAFPNPSLYAP